MKNKKNFIKKYINFILIFLITLCFFLVICDKIFNLGIIHDGDKYLI